MFGISWGEFFVILLVGVIVIPARYWPDVIQFFAHGVRVVRRFLWRLADTSENIKNQIELERPIDEIVETATDFLDSFSQPRPARASKKSKSRHQSKGKK